MTPKKSAQQQQSRERRRFFRLIYPVDARPIYKSQKVEYFISEASEKSIRVLWVSGGIPPLGHQEKGTVILNEGPPIDVTAKVIKIVDKDVILELEPGISLPQMMAEHRKIIKRYSRLG